MAGVAMAAVMVVAMVEATEVAMVEYRPPRQHSIEQRAMTIWDHTSTRGQRHGRHEQTCDAPRHMHARTAPIPIRTPHRVRSHCSSLQPALDVYIGERHTVGIVPLPGVVSRPHNAASLVMR